MDKGTVLTGKDKINLARVITLKHALELEMRGMKHSSGISAYTRIKKEFGWTGNRAKILGELDAEIEKRDMETLNSPQLLGLWKTLL